MCSQSDDPTQYDTPTFTKPRTYVLAGDAPVAEEPQPSVALAVIGTMLDEAERALGRGYPQDLLYDDDRLAWSRVNALRDARERIAKAEAAE